MQTLDASCHSHRTRNPRRAVYDHETLALLLNPADPQQADFLLNLRALEHLEARLGSPDWTDEDHGRLIRLCHQIRNQICCLTLEHDVLNLHQGATPQSNATLEALGRFAALIKADHQGPPQPVAG